MRYLFLGYADQDAERRWTPAELDAVIEEHASFAGRMREEGRYVFGAGLDARDAPAVVRRNGAGDFVVTDGPFAETSEQIGGLYVLDCADRAEALALAKQMPHTPGVAIEVRPAPY
jgi:hypothetical protein